MKFENMPDFHLHVIHKTENVKIKKTFLFEAGQLFKLVLDARRGVISTNNGLFSESL